MAAGSVFVSMVITVPGATDGEIWLRQISFQLLRHQRFVGCFPVGCEELDAAFVEQLNRPLADAPDYDGLHALLGKP